MTVKEYWKRYLKDTNQKEEDVCFSGELSFENGGFVDFTRLDLILNEQKTAIFTPFDDYYINREPLPAIGEMHIIEDLDGKPCAIVKTIDVKIIPFDQITWALARRDGEDETFDVWKEKMEEFLIDEAQIVGYKYTPDLKIVCEIFQLVYKRQF